MAVGKSARISTDIETAFLYLDDRPVLAYSLAAFMQCPEIEGIVIGVNRARAESVLAMVQMLGISKVKKIVGVGVQRTAAMAACMGHIPEDVDLVCLHDASWPMVTPEIISQTVVTASRHGAAVAAVELFDPVVTAKKNVFTSRVGGDERMWSVISPQTYPRAALAQAYPQAQAKRKNYSDDLAAMQAQKLEPRLVTVNTPSLRIRSSDDLQPVLALMK